MDRPTLLECRDLTYEINSARLLNGVNFSARAGAVTTVMGPNGAGKSLLLRLVHGLIAPTSGEIRWRGRQLDRIARSRQAMVFQRPVLLRRSVLANIRFALSVQGVRGSRRSALESEALDLAGLTARSHLPARMLSVGEQQRLAIARALACQPEMLLLDEPTANLDTSSTAAVETMLRDARASGVAVLLVTHNKGQAQRLADQAIFLHEGRVCEFGPPLEWLSNPKTDPARAWLEDRLYVSHAAQVNDCSPTE